MTNNRQQSEQLQESLRKWTNSDDGDNAISRAIETAQTTAKNLREARRVTAEALHKPFNL